MNYPDSWGAYGGIYRRCTPPAQRMRLQLDPITCAYVVILMNVLVGMRDFKWLTTACSILTDHDAFLEKIKPSKEAKTRTHTTCAKYWLPTLEQLARSGVLDELAANAPRRAYGRFFIVEKPGLGDLGRGIFDLSIFSRLCARPYPVNLPHLPQILWMIGSWRHKNGFAWAGDYRHWFLQNGFPDPRTRAFFCLECDNKYFQARVTVMGWSWSCFTNQCVTWGIVLGEFPAKLRQYVDWEALKGDTPPAFVPLRDHHGNVIGVILCVYDNIYVFGEDEWLVEKIRKHVIQRSAFCKAVFKCCYCEKCGTHRPKEDVCGECKKNGYVGALGPDPTGKSVDLLGGIMAFNGTRWTWTHRDTSGWTTEVPKVAPRREVAHFVGVLVWDACVSLETMQRIEPAMTILRRITKGVSCRQQWKETVTLTDEEVITLKSLTQQVLDRGEMGVVDTICPLRSAIAGCAIPNVQKVVYVATDASNPKVAWAEITRLTCDNVEHFLRGKNFDWGLAVGPHIFYKELQAASWGIQEMCWRYSGVTIVIATDNSAVFFLLRRGFSGQLLAIPHMEMIRDHLLASGNSILPILIPGVQNFSDSPTRDMPLDVDRLRATWDHMQAAVSGGSRKVASWSLKRPRDFLERCAIEEAPEEILAEHDAFEGREDED